MGIEAEEIGIETPVEEAAPEVLEEVRMIDVQVRLISLYLRSKKVDWDRQGQKRLSLRRQAGL